MRSRHGFTLIEVVLAIFIFSLAILVLFNNFAAHRRVSVADRDRTAAQLLAANLLEEVKAHPFGLPAPDYWPPDNSAPSDLASAPEEELFLIPVYVEGHPQQMRFHRRLSYEGSLVGQGSGADHDVVTVVISWRDPGQPKLKQLEARTVARLR